MLLGLCAWLGSGVQAQGLLGSNPSLPQIHARALAWADYDGDGDADLFAAGMDASGQRQSYLLRNDSTAFTPVSHPVPDLADAAAIWTDVDNDGDPDLIASGSTAPLVAHTSLYMNLGSGSFSATSLPCPALLDGVLIAGDFDTDGDSDLVLAGWNAYRLGLTLALRNDSSLGFVQVWDTLHPGLFHAVGCQGDYDNDGDSDVLLSGMDNTDQPMTYILRNQGGFVFYRRGYGLPQVVQGGAEWADHDLDGDLDIFIGGSAPGKVGRLYEYQTDQYLATADTFPALAYGWGHWGNFDPGSSGYPDLFMGGETDYGHKSWVFENTGGAYGNLQPTYPIVGLIETFMAWEDWNGDGYLDFVISGLDTNREPLMALYLYNPTLQRFQP